MAFGLVGRVDELARLRALVRDLQQGHGAVAWIQGEPGVGKSSLIASVLSEDSAHGVRTFQAIGDEFAAPVGLRFLAESLLSGEIDNLREEIADLMAGRGGGLDAMLAATERMVALVEQECNRGPVALVLDDLQWADDESLAALHGLLRVTDQSPLLIIAATRPMLGRDALARLHTAVLRRPGALQLELGPLDDAAVTALVTSRTRATPGPSLHARVAAAGGNPFYVLELTDALMAQGLVTIADGFAEIPADAQALPSSLRAAIGRHIGLLSEQTRATLQMAAVLDGRFTVSELSSMSATAAPEVARAVQEATAAGALTKVGQELTFRHPLIRQVLHDEVPLAVRVGLHEHAARLLAEAGASWERVARHLLAAPEAIDGWALGWLVAIPRSALLARPAIAVDLLGRARLALPPGDPRRDHVTARLAAVLQFLSRPDDLLALGTQALHGMADPAAAGEFAWHLARGCQMAPGHNDEGVAIVQAFLDRTDPGAPWRSRLLAQRAVLVGNAGRADEALRHVAEAIEAGERDGDPISVGLALNAQLQASDLPEAVEVVERALALPFADDPHSIDVRILLLANRLVALLSLRRWQEFETALAATVAEAERVGTQRLTEVQWTASSYYFNLGDWDRSLLYASQIDIQTARQALGVRGNIALIHAHRGETELAAEQLAAVSDIPYLDQMSTLIAALPLIEAQALLAESEGDLARASQLLSVWLEPRIDASPHAMGIPAVDLVMLARIAIAVGDMPLAQTAGDKARRRAEHIPELACYSRAIAGMLTGDPAPLLTAIDGLDAEGETFDAAIVAEEAAVALARRGEHDRARAAFLRAAGDYDSRGAANELRRLQHRLRPFGIQRGSRAARRTATYGWESLTDAEHKVVRLVAEGYTNSEIGARLFVSRRTVETHVAHVLRKLQLRSRVDIRLAVMAQAQPAGAVEAD